MSSRIIFSILCLLLVSCDDASKSSGGTAASTNDGNTSPDAPIKTESGVWVIETFSLGNNTWTGWGRSGSLPFEPRTMMLMENKAFFL